MTTTFPSDVTYEEADGQLVFLEVLAVGPAPAERPLLPGADWWLRRIRDCSCWHGVWSHDAGGRCRVPRCDCGLY